MNYALEHTDLNRPSGSGLHFQLLWRLKQEVFKFKTSMGN